MCTYATMRSEIDGSAKGPGGSWFHVTDATVYFDHPVHAMAEHTLNIDFANPASGPSARVAVELTEASAQELLVAIRAALASATSSGISGRAPRSGAQQEDQVHAEFEEGHPQ
jgi:uncharacterized protein DUF6295